MNEWIQILDAVHRTLCENEALYRRVAEVLRPHHSDLSRGLEQISQLHLDCLRLLEGTRAQKARPS